jgi:hypothetical protein
MLVRRSTTMPSPELQSDWNRLNPNAYYCVYAMYIGSPSEFIIYLDDSPSCPLIFDERIFDVLDQRVSRYWSYSPPQSLPNSDELSAPSFGFEEWCADPYFYSDLVEGIGDTGKIWHRNKAKMEFEFTRPDVNLFAEPLNNEWLQCCKCLDAWEYSEIDELVQCPNCDTIQNRSKDIERSKTTTKKTLSNK